MTINIPNQRGSAQQVAFEIREKFKKNFNSLAGQIHWN